MEMEDEVMSAVANTITRRIRAKRRGWVFTPKDFLDVGGRATVDQTLSRLARKGVVRRLDHGLYDYPKQHDKLGTLSPSADDLAQAIATKTGDQIFPSGAAAANYLGLSTQVPARPVYLTNGSSRTKKVAGRTIVLKHARVPIMNRMTDKANFMLQALSYLGQNSIDDRLIQKCVDRLDDRDMKDLSVSVPRIPGWMADVILKMQQTKYG
jgi:Family of unknown function (DUF6088)